ncbi:MAG: SusC/RagA family TonB-linked outer membrane protein [Bacteroidia bacterium]
MSLFGQNAILSGKILDENDEGLIGATVMLQGTTKGTVADPMGNYTISDIAPGTYQVVYSFIGYKTVAESVTLSAGQSLSLNKKLEADILFLDEAVVVGYGTISSGDLTGSTRVIKDEDFTKGNVTTPEQLITGKVSGVQITSNNGAPGSGSRIRIRGGTSINASNDPLIVIDGVPVDNEAINGSPDPLSLINPNDIESFVVLKDASAAAIYGSRGANGVILITTKKGKGSSRLRLNLQQNLSLSTVAKQVPVLSADELKDVVNTYGTDAQKSVLGDANTNWQDEIYRNALISETNIGMSGGVKNLPYRLTLNYKYEEGALHRHQLERTSVGLNLTPSFFNDNLKLEINTKFTMMDNFFADQGAIGAAISFDPTQPVNSGADAFGGYFEWLNPAGTKPNNLAIKNPVGLLNQKDDVSNVLRFIGNAKMDYRFPFLPDLHAVVNVGTDYTNSNGSVTISDAAASQFLQGGERSQYEQTKTNELLEAYFNYKKALPGAKSEIDLTAGYSYQFWTRDEPAFALLSYNYDTVRAANIPFYTENALISYYGRMNYTYNKKYVLTATLRRDGSSRFAPENRWGMFPSAAFAWKISDEDFLDGNLVVSHLKLRAGYGITGQQDIGNDYPYQANYQTSTTTAQYQFGNQFFNLLRPDGFDYNIKWEETASSNIGLDFGFLNDRIYGSLDFYVKNTSDLLAIVDVPAGANFKNEILTNVGSMTNSGIEFEFNWVAISDGKRELIFGANATANRNEITKLTRIPDESSVGILTGGIEGGIGNNVQIHAVGHPANSFYVYEQLYGDDGKPLEGEFADRNGDGLVNEDDRYIAQNPNPDMMLGFFGNYQTGDWTFAFNMRAEFGRYVYNNVNSTRGFYQAIPAENWMINLNPSFFDSEIIAASTEQYLSDYWIEKANFLRMDYFRVGYDLGETFKGKANVQVGATVNNVFVWSPYSGIDPEAINDGNLGIDLNLYPRPRIFALNLNVTF